MNPLLGKHPEGRSTSVSVLEGGLPSLTISGLVYLPVLKRPGQTDARNKRRAHLVLTVSLRISPVKRALPS